MLSPIVCLLAATCLGAPPEPLALTVDPGAAPGPLRSPTLIGALEAAASAKDCPAITIDIKPGVYELRQSAVIKNLSAPLTIRAKPGTVRFIGGVSLRATPAPMASADPLRTRAPAESLDAIRTIDLAPALGGAKLAPPERHGMNLPPASGSELFMDRRPLVSARWPNDGRASIAGVVDAGTTKQDAPGAQRPGTFRFADHERLVRWAGATDLWLHGYWRWDWADDQMPAGKVDPDAGTIALGLPHAYGVGKTATFQVVNIPEELDVPGEYWLDPEHARAYLIPPPNQTPGESEFTISTLNEPMLALEGAAQVEISGVDFEACRALAIRAVDAARIRITDCVFRNTGTGAIDLNGRDCEVTRCTFEDIGAFGVALSGGDRSTLTHGANSVHDCLFRRCGRTHPTYQPAIRLEGVGQSVAHNLIEDLPHSALIFAGNEHVIELNEIARVLLETGDCGAIYCGRDWTLHGTVIRHNFIHDIKGTDARYQNAVYLDDMASGITVEGNIMLRCNWGMLVGGGRDITIHGNVFASCSKGLSFDNRGVGWMAKNIADPASSTLHQRLRAVPIDREPWKSRYPTLGAYLTDRFGRPVNGRFDENVLLATPFGKVADRECVSVSKNTEKPDALPPDVVADLLDPARRRDMHALIPDGAPKGFGPIPVGEIGPRDQPGRKPAGR